MELELHNKVVCITGGSEGIGLATASAFAAEGARVVICARRQEKLDAAVAAIQDDHGVMIEAVSADVTVPQDLDRLIEHIATRHGRLDVLVNNAGTGIYKPFADVTDEELTRGMSINFFAQFRMTQRALPLLRLASAPVVINVSGRTAIRGNFPPGSSCTGPAKAAEVRFSIDLATELADQGIRVNCVVPGVVKAPERFELWERERAGVQWDADRAQHVRDQMETASMPQGQQWGVPADIANVIVFMSSSRASYINGVALTVDGGPHTKSYVTQLHTTTPRI